MDDKGLDGDDDVLLVLSLAKGVTTTHMGRFVSSHSSLESGKRLDTGRIEEDGMVR
jgi:hypothetical protein